MPFPPMDKTLQGLLSDTTERLTLVERRLVRATTDTATLVTEGAGIDVTGDGSAATPYVIAATAARGTTAARDTLYGVPSTAAQQAALANQLPSWLNTELGWPESYYAPTGTAGLVAPGLLAGSAAGWYPTSLGPAISLIAGAQQAMTTGNTYTGWSAPGTGRSWRRGGAAYFSYAAGVITAVRAGRYRVLCEGTAQQGTGSVLMYLIRGPAAADPNLSAQAVATLGTWDVSFQLPMMNAALPAGESLRLYAGSVGSVIFMQGADSQRERVGMFTVEYIGPALVTD